jgi:hypothetical protein
MKVPAPAGSGRFKIRCGFLTFLWSRSLLGGAAKMNRCF